MSEDKKEVMVPEKFKSIVAEIEKMSVLDLPELVKILDIRKLCLLSQIF